MGLFDSLINNVLGDGNPQQNRVDGADQGEGISGRAVMAILQWVQLQGGWHIILEKLQQGGLGNILESWLGQGENAPVETQQLHRVFGQDSLTSLAESLGTNTDGALAQLQRCLPQLMDKVSPKGNVEPEAENSLFNAASTDLSGIINTIFGKK
ncbi:YidB family protein [Enterobacteriaceae bacterium LUAb1]